MQTPAFAVLPIVVIVLALFSAGCSGGKPEDRGGKSSGAAVKPALPTVTAATNALGKSVKSPFTSEASADFMRKVMETRARIDGVKKEIEARKTKLYATDPELQQSRAQLIQMQTQINTILAADSELAQLKLKRDILLTVMPTLPTRNFHPGALRDKLAKPVGPRTGG